MANWKKKKDVLYNIWKNFLALSSTACTKMAVMLAWISSHFQAGFQSQSSQGCNTEEKQESAAQNVHSQ